MLDDLDDILGERPIRRERRPNLKAAAAGRGLEDVGGVTAIKRPVTANTLATLFDMEVPTINRRLIPCPFVMQGNRKLYDFKEACSWIIKPKMTNEQFIKTLNSSHLPPEINKTFWDGQRSRVKFALEAQEAWETDDVLAVFGDTFMALKDWITTMIEMLRDRGKLTDDQTKLVEAACDDLRMTLREKLLEMPKQKRTGSMFHKPLFGAPENMSVVPEMDEEDE